MSWWGSHELQYFISPSLMSVSVSERKNYQQHHPNQPTLSWSGSSTVRIQKHYWYAKYITGKALCLAAGPSASTVASQFLRLDMSYRKLVLEFWTGAHGLWRWKENNEVDWAKTSFHKKWLSAKPWRFLNMEMTSTMRTFTEHTTVKNSIRQGVDS